MSGSVKSARKLYTLIAGDWIFFDVFFFTFFSLIFLQIVACNYCKSDAEHVHVCCLTHWLSTEK